MSSDVRAALDRSTADYRASMGDNLDSGGAGYARGRLLEAIGATEEALEVWLELLESPSPTVRPTLLHALLRCAHRDGAVDRVSAALARRAVVAPSVGTWRGHLLRTAGRATEAVAVLQATLRGSLTPEERFAAGNELLQAEREAR